MSTSIFAGGTPVPGGTGGGRPTPPNTGHGMKVPPWLKDPKVQLGIGAAAIVGLVVFLRRGGAAGVDTSADGARSVQPAVMDSSGTDIYNAIQSLGQGWENDLRDYQDTLDSVATQVKDNTTGLATLNTTVGKLGQTKPPSGTVTPPKPPAKTPAKTPAKSTPVYATVTKYTSGSTSWSSTLSGIAKHFGTSVSTLQKLNPKITNVNKVQVGQKVRVK